MKYKELFYLTAIRCHLLSARLSQKRIAFARSPTFAAEERRWKTDNSCRIKQMPNASGYTELCDCTNCTPYVNWTSDLNLSRFYTKLSWDNWLQGRAFFLRSCSALSRWRNYRSCLQTECLLQCLRQVLPGLYPEPDESCHTHPISEGKLILILPQNVGVQSPMWSLTSAFQLNVLMNISIRSHSLRISST